jgi:hypothetical protein
MCRSCALSLGSEGLGNRSEMFTRTIPCRVRRGEAHQSMRKIGNFRSERWKQLPACTARLLQPAKA